MPITPTAEELEHLRNRREQTKRDLLDDITYLRERVMRCEHELDDMRRSVLDKERQLLALDKLLEADGDVIATGITHAENSGQSG